MIGIGTAKRELADENFARFHRVFGQCQDIRRIGSAALELAYTACGRQGGYFEIYLNPWDYLCWYAFNTGSWWKSNRFYGKRFESKKRRKCCRNKWIYPYRASTTVVIYLCDKMQ